MNYINELDKCIRLKDGKNVIEKALELVYLFGPLSSKNLARELLLPVPVVTALKKECIKLGLWADTKGINSTIKGNLYLREECGFEGIDREKYISILKSKDTQEQVIKSLSEKYREIFDLRPGVDVTVDQAKCTVETSFRRAVLCLLNSSLIGKNVLCVGDDDFVSIAMGLLLSDLFKDVNNSKTRITVFELDNRYIDYIKRTADEYSLPIDCVEVNLRNALPQEYINSFDCFFTDPPYTIEGAKLFLSRGVSLLKKEKGNKVFFSFANKPIDEMYLLQKCINMLGLIVKEVLPNFNEYEGASLLGGISQMMILESTEHVRTLVPEKKEFRSAIYTREKKLPNSIYTCKGCNKIYRIGNGGDSRTIEELKEHGCKACGGKSFIRNSNKVREISTDNRSLGRHILAEFYGCDADELDNQDNIQVYMRKAAIKAKATIVNESFHKFSPWGVSGVIVIQESHLTIHTWPEYGYAAVDLFTCGKDIDSWAAFEFLNEKFKCNYVEFTNLIRGDLDSIKRFM